MMGADSANDQPERKQAKTAKRPARGAQPAWADGLRRLYDSVVEEPVPQVFDDLLKRLAEAEDDDKLRKHG